MKLLPNWRRVLTRAWSVRFMALAGVLSGGEVAMPYLEGVLPIERGTFAALSGLLSAAALVARVFAQKELATDA